MKYEWRMDSPHLWPAIRVSLNRSGYEVYDWCSKFVWNDGGETVIEDQGIFTLAVI